jgi:hypothetical protein
MNDNQHLDNILDDALGEYREAEPLAGLEDRVLQRVRLQPEKRLLTLWKWGAIAACAAMLAIVAWLGWREHGAQIQINVARPPVEARSTSAPPPTEGPAHSTRTDPSASRSLNQLRAESDRNVGGRSQATDIRQTQAAVHNADGPEYLRQPTPLTPEERQLLALAQTHPDALRAVSQEDQPITIAPLTIQPLLSEANRNGDN